MDQIVNAFGSKYFFKTLEYVCSIFVTLTISLGLMNPVFKNKKIYFPSTAVYHKNNTENISLTEQFEHQQSYFVL